MEYNEQHLPYINQDTEMYYDLFYHYDKQPPELAKVILKYSNQIDDELSYEVAADMLEEVMELGFDFEYGLDSGPYALRPVGVAKELVEDPED